MAENVKTPSIGDQLKRKRGRPSKAEAEARAAAKIKADQMVAAAGNTPKAAPDPAPEKPAATRPPEDQRAPGLGHNAPDENLFLKHVHSITQFKEGPLAEAKAKVKELSGKLKDLRQLAKADGLVLKELDDAVEDARTERVDLAAKEERRRLYRLWLGLPTSTSDLAEEDAAIPSLAREQLRWEAMGNTAGRLGRDRGAPDDCPANMESHYDKGWTKGQAALLKASPLTAGAFDANGDLKGPSPAAMAAAASATAAATGVENGEADRESAAPAQAAAESQATAVLILGPTDFDTAELDEANRATLVSDALRGRFDNAERVVAVFGGKRRIIKEPGYVDDGGHETELSEAEPAKPEEVAAVHDRPLADVGDDAQDETQAEDPAAEDDDAPIDGEKPIEDDAGDPSEKFH